MSQRFSQKRWKLGRRTFLKLSGAALATAGEMANASVRVPRLLTATPSPDDLASTEMEYSFTDLFNMPVFQNEWGYGQVSKSVSGVTGITFPPYACCGVPEVTWSPGLLTSCEIVLNGQLLSIAPPPGNRVKYRWLPQRVDREQTVSGIRIRTRTFMPVKQRAVAEHIDLTNISSQRQRLTLGFDMQAAVIKKTTFWMAGCPGEGGNRQAWDATKGRVTFVARQSQASSAQGIFPVAQNLVGGHILQYEIQLSPGETRRF